MIGQKLEQLLLDWNITTVIFDLDGTLVDTLDNHTKAFQLLFEELSVDIAVERIEENMGRTPKDILLTLMPELREDPKALVKLSDRKESILTGTLTNIRILPGSVALLKYLKKRKYLLCLASSTPLFNVSKILSEASLESFFDVVITGEDIVVGKPNPEVFLKAIHKANSSVDKALVIGDSPHDINAAKKAGIKVIGVATGKHTFNQLDAAKPTLLVSNLSEL